MTSELKACPFCGCQPTLDRFNARCPGCEAEINAAPGLAAAAWNRRAPSPAVARLVEACQGLIELQRSIGGPKPEEVRTAQAALEAVEKEIGT